MMKNTLNKNIFLKNQRGQALVEYILLNLVVMIVLVKLIAGVADAVGNFFQNSYGDYFICLLETGELPTLGGEDNPDLECNDTFEPFTIAKGRPIKDFGTEGGENGNLNGGSKYSSSGSSDSSSDDASGSSSSGAESRGGLRPGFAKGFQGRPQKVPLSNADKGAGKKSGEDASAAGGLNNFEEPESFGDDGSGRSGVVPIYYGDMEDPEKKSEELVKSDIPENPEQALRGRRVPANSDANKKLEKEVDASMSFPDFIKYLIIAAILLVIVIFLGGQVMQFQKSKD